MRSTICEYETQKLWSEIILIYMMIEERYPNPNGGVGDLIPGHEVFSLLDILKKLAKRPCTTCAPK